MDQDDYYNIIQYLNARKAAAPAFIHYSSESFEGNSKSVTKLVECPVVLRVPALKLTAHQYLDTTLYNGH